MLTNDIVSFEQLGPDHEVLVQIHLMVSFPWQNTSCDHDLHCLLLIQQFLDTSVGFVQVLREVQF